MCRSLPSQPSISLSASCWQLSYIWSTRSPIMHHLVPRCKEKPRPCWAKSPISSKADHKHLNSTRLQLQYLKPVNHIAKMTTKPLAIMWNVYKPLVGLKQTLLHNPRFQVWLDELFRNPYFDLWLLFQFERLVLALLFVLIHTLMYNFCCSLKG